MKFPATIEDLRAACWVHKESRHCRACGVALEFWRTANDKLMPLEPVMLDGQMVYVSHWATCPKADSFRKSKAGPPKAALPKFEPRVQGQQDDLKFEE